MKREREEGNPGAPGFHCVQKREGYSGAVGLGAGWLILDAQIPGPGALTESRISPESSFSGFALRKFPRSI